MAFETQDEDHKKLTNSTTEDISMFLWLVIYFSTFFHAGLTAWAMLSTAQLPPGYQTPPRWVDFLGQGPNSNTFWFYILSLSANIIWESWFKGPKTYVPSSFPNPESLYSQSAITLWVALWGLAHFGHYQGWFPVPNWVNETFVICVCLRFFQHKLMKFLNNSGEFKVPFLGNSPRLHTDLPTAQTPNPQLSLTPSTPNQPVSTNSDLTEKMLDYVRQKGQAQTSGLIGVLGSPRRTVIRNLNKLLEEGKLIREGTGRGAVYRLNENPKDGKWN